MIRRGVARLCGRHEFTPVVIGHSAPLEAERQKHHARKGAQERHEPVGGAGNNRPYGYSFVATGPLVTEPSYQMSRKNGLTFRRLGRNRACLLLFPVTSGTSRANKRKCQTCLRNCFVRLGHRGNRTCSAFPCCLPCRGGHNVMAATLQQDAFRMGLNQA